MRRRLLFLIMALTKQWQNKKSFRTNRTIFTLAPCKVSTPLFSFYILHFYSFLIFLMLDTNEIASITILVPYQRGNETINQIIPFKVFRLQQHYKAIPLISTEERELTGLSPELSFRLIENRIIPQAKANEASLNAINNIAGELRMLGVF